MSTALAASSEFHAVVVPDGAPPSCYAFATRDELAEFLRHLPEADAYCFVYAGRRLGLTASPPRLLFDGHEVLDLSPPRAVAPPSPDPGDGRLGSDPAELDAGYASLTPDFGEPTP